MELLRPASGDGHWLASDRLGSIEVRFVGLGPLCDRLKLLAAVGGEELELAWCRQVHSDRVVKASAGECGEGDALIADRPGLALAVATADCVPVVIGGRDRVAAIHAGWRGIAASIVDRALERLDHPDSLTAWLGPAIGSCCYEVGAEVAEAVVAASGAAVLAGLGTPRPHLDLHRAVTVQLERAGVRDIRRVEACTRCRAEALSSYRRDGVRAGRNVAFAWLRSQ